MLKQDEEQHILPRLVDASTNGGSAFCRLVAVVAVLAIFAGLLSPCGSNRRSIRSPNCHATPGLAG